MTYLRKPVAVALAALALMRAAHGQVLPNVVQPDGAAEGDFIEVLESLASDGLTVLIFVVGAAAFLMVGWAVIAKFNECRQGRAEWSEAAVTAGIGAVVLIFATFLLTQASTIFA